MPKVLIVEDDLMIADAAEEALLERGHEVCGIARIATEAIAFGGLTSLTRRSSGNGTEWATRTW
jgi:hypothetical protein